MENIDDFYHSTLDSAKNMTIMISVIGGCPDGKNSMNGCLKTTVRMFENGGDQYEILPENHKLI